MWALNQGTASSLRAGRSLHQQSLRRTTAPLRRVYARAVQGAGAPVAAARERSSSYDAIWDAFSSKVQGEWEGVTVTFDAAGIAQPLPERYVPGAYREWGVELFDWQSQSSCTITPPGSRSLRNIFKRLMPTVGCEADAIAFVEEAADVWQSDGGSPVKPVTADGGYLAAPPQLPPAGTAGAKFKVEACLAAAGGKTRLRATLTLMQHWESTQWQVVFVDLCRETFYGTFNGGVELSGCAGGGKPFAKEPATAAEALAGEWRPAAAAPGGAPLRYHLSEASGQLELQQASAAAAGSSPSAPPLLLLPLGVWVACTAAGGDVSVEVGALRSSSSGGSGGESEQQQQRDVARCAYVAGRLERVELACEARA